MNLKEYRDEIDKLDEKIVSLLEERLKIASKLKGLKKEILDSNRENEILDRIESKDIREIYQEIFEISKKIQAN